MGNAKLKDEDQNGIFEDELPAGSTLMHGQYTIDRFLNAGGFGITYAARDSLDRKVVIKECFPGAFCRRSHALVNARSRAHKTELQSIVRLFVQEARSLAKLNHPNIVGVHQVFEENNTAYMALDFVEGRDLLEVIEDGIVDLTPELTTSILRKVLDAVEFIHSQGMLHRDISPDNILLDNNMEPVLIDFGAAREQATKQSRVLSALRVVKDGYSPQEFYISGSEQGPYSDLYALGASFYHLITKELPPNSQARLAAIASGESDPYQPAMWRVNGYSVDFLAALDKSLEVLPKDRISKASDWIAMLDGQMAVPAKAAPEPEPAPEDRPVDTAPVAPRAAPAVKSEPKKKKSKMGLLLASVAAVAIVGVFAANQVNQGVPAGGSAEDNATETALSDPATPQLPSDPVATDPAVPQSQAPETIKSPSLFVDVAPFPSGAEEANAGPSPSGTLTLPAILEPDLVSTAPRRISEPFGPDLLPGAAQTANPEAAPPILAVETSKPPKLRRRLPVPEFQAALPVQGFDSTGRFFRISPPDTLGVIDPDILRTFAPVLATLPIDEVPVVDTALPAEPVDPKPVVLPPISGLVSEWTLELPYDGLFEAADGETRIFAINGIPVADKAAFDAAIQETEVLGDSAFVEVAVSIGASLFTQSEQIWQLPVSRTVKLANGMEFRTQFENDQWVTRVAEVSNDLRLDLEVGDVVFGNLVTSEAINTRDALSDMMRREIEAGQTNFVFAISRDGNNWAVSFTYNPQSNG